MLINVHTHSHSTTKNVVSINNISLDCVKNISAPSHYFSAGIHPWNIDHNSESLLPKLTEIVSNANCLAIGECGLDRLNGPDLNTQTAIFKRHYELSERFKKPLIIHCVRAYSEIIKLRKDWQPKQVWIFHGFNASEQIIKQAIKHRFYFSFGPSILNTSSKAIQTIPFVPYNSLFLETDDKSNISIKSIYETYSNISKINLSQLQMIIEFNFNRLFNVDI